MVFVPALRARTGPHHRRPRACASAEEGDEEAYRRGRRGTLPPDAQRVLGSHQPGGSAEYHPRAAYLCRGRRLPCSATGADRPDAAAHGHGRLGHRPRPADALDRAWRWLHHREDAEPLVRGASEVTRQVYSSWREHADGFIVGRTQWTGMIDEGSFEYVGGMAISLNHPESPWATTPLK